MNYKTVNGDLIEMSDNGEFDMMVHGANCFHTMGSGIAGQLVKKWPQVLEIDKSHTKEGDYLKLGRYSGVECPTKNGSVIVINAYTQFKFGAVNGPYNTEVHADYNAIYRVFSDLVKDNRGQRIGFPMIGAGLAGGNWDIISAIISNIVKQDTHNEWTLVKFENHWTSIHE